jgi:hypothetical protein
MRVVGQRLNLKGHWTGLGVRQYIYGAGDVEVHEGTDGRYYVLDFARLEITCHYLQPFNIVLLSINICIDVLLLKLLMVVDREEFFQNFYVQNLREHIK